MTPHQPGPGYGPSGCRLFIGTCNGLLLGKFRSLGTAPSMGLVSCHPDMRLLMTRVFFLISLTTLCSHSSPQNRALDQAKVPNFLAAIGGWRYKEGYGDALPPPHPRGWKAPSGPARGSAESRGCRRSASLYRPSLGAVSDDAHLQPPRPGLPGGLAQPLPGGRAVPRRPPCPGLLATFSSRRPAAGARRLEAAPHYCSGDKD